MKKKKVIVLRERERERFVVEQKSQTFWYTCKRKWNKEQLDNFSSAYVGYEDYKMQRQMLNPTVTACWSWWRPQISIISNTMHKRATYPKVKSTWQFPIHQNKCEYNY